jgi:lipopolysaccharide export system permease protein
MLRQPITISIYILKQYVFYFFAILGGIAAVILMFDVVEFIRLLHNKNVPMGTIVQMALLKNLDHVLKILAYVCLISTIVTYSKLTKTNELIIARAGGLSVWQFLAPVVVFAFLFGLFNITLINPLMANFLRKFEKYESQLLKGHASMMALSPTGLWIIQSDNHGHKNILHALRVHQNSNEIYDFTMYFIDNKGNFQKRVDGTKAQLDDGYWRMTNAISTAAGHDEQRFEKLDIETNISFKQIQESMISPETVSFWQLRNFISIAEESGLSAMRHKLYFYKLLASPLLLAALVLIGSFFALSIPRSGKAQRNLVFGLLIGFVIYFFSDVIFALGLTGKMPLMLAAFSPALICSLAGLYIIIHIEE